MVKTKIGFLTATALVVANMIGTGVFTTLGFQTAALPAVSVLLLLWLCGGVVALCGGLCYVELARLYPGSGGEYHYLRSAYHPWLGQLSRVISILAGFAAPVALSAMAFSAYLAKLWPEINVSLSALAIITLITGFHCFTLKLGSRFQLISTGLKLLLILVFITAGLLHKSSHTSPGLSKDQIQLVFSPAFASALVYVSFAYSGWNACVYIFNEIERPVRNICASITFGTLLVTLLYLLLNYIFLKAVPFQELTGVIEVGALAAVKIFGPAGGKLVSGMISLLLVSTMSAMIWVGPRVIKPAQKGMPLGAMGLQYLITVILVLSGAFSQILANAAIFLNLSSCAAVGILFFNYRMIRPGLLVAAGIFITITLWSSYHLYFNL